MIGTSFQASPSPATTAMAAAEHPATATDTGAAAQAWEGRAAPLVAEICRKIGVSEATFYLWKKKFGGLGPSELRRLRQLEEENRKLKQLVADLSLDKAMLQEVVAKKL